MKRKTMLNQFKRSIARFMIGRYGPDPLNNTLNVILFILLFWSLLDPRNQLLRWLYLIVFVTLMFRFLSKNKAKRRAENALFMKWTRSIRSRYRVIVFNLKDRNHKVYICPQCNAKVRIPSGHGKVAITCPHCRHEFTKRS